MSKVTNTTCVLPWIHFSLKPNGDVKPCCRFATYADDQTSTEFLNFNVSKFSNATNILDSQQLEYIRQKMLNGEKLSGCNKCYIEEEIHGRSMRIGVNRDYDVEDVVNNNKIGLQYLEVGFGNYCNLACRSCGADLSTSWFEDDKIMEKYYDRTVEEKIQNSKFLWKPDDFESVTYIKFTGGEPMLHPNFIKFLDVIISGDHQNHITLEVFTNCSWIPKEKILGRLRKFKNVKICLSVDGTDEVNNYVRHLSKWEVVKNSLEIWINFEKETPNLSSFLTLTVSMYTIFNIKKLIIFWKDLRAQNNLTITHDSGNIVTNIVTYPEYISLNLLPDTEEIIKDLELYINENQGMHTVPLERIVKVLKNKKTSSYDLEYFMDYTSDLDKLRKQSLKNSIPELWHHLEKYFNTIGKDINSFKGKVNE